MSDRLDAAIVELAAALRAELAAKAPPQPGLPRLVSVEAAAQALGLARSSVYRLVSDGALRTVKVGGRRLVSEAALAEFIAHAEALASSPEHSISRPGYPRRSGRRT